MGLMGFRLICSKHTSDEGVFAGRRQLEGDTRGPVMADLSCDRRV
jgi:hypothetical protein